MKTLLMTMLIAVTVVATAQNRTLVNDNVASVEYTFGTFDNEPYGMLSFQDARYSHIVALGYVHFDTQDEVRQFCRSVKYLLELDADLTDMVSENNYRVTVMRIGRGRITVEDTTNGAYTSLTFRQAERLVETLEKNLHLL